MTSTAESRILAERYARALLEVVLEKKSDPRKVLGELESAAKVVLSHAKLAYVLSTTTVPDDKRVAVLYELFGSRGLEASTMNLLRILTVKERIPILEFVVEQYRRLVLQHEKVQPGEVTSAQVLTGDQQKQLAENLGKALGKTMELSFETDANLVGGLVVRIGNRVYDASVVTQLQRFKEKALSSL